MAQTEDLKHIDPNEVDSSILKEFQVQNQNPCEVGYQADVDVRRKRFRLQQQWKVCTYFVNGDQWIRWSPQANLMDRISEIIDSKRPDIVRPVFNMILPAYDQKMTSLTQVRHIPSVVPAPGRGDQLENARMQTQFLEALWLVLKMRELDIRVKGGCTLWGNTWLKTAYDFKKNLPTLTYKSPFEVAVYPWGVKRVEDGEATIETGAVPVESLKYKHPKALEDWDKDSREELNEEYDTLLTSTDSFIGHQGMGGGNIEGMVTVREIHRRPCQKHPRGYKMLCTRKRLLELKPLQDPDLWPNYFQFWYRYMPDAMYPPGLVWPVVSQQVMLNKLGSDIYSDLHRKAHARRMIRASSRLTPEKFDDLGTDLVWEDDPDMPDQGPLTWDVPPDAKQDFWKAFDLVKTALDNQLQLHDPSRGKPGANVQSGYQVELLQARDDAHTVPTLSVMDDQYGRVWKRLLMLTARHQTGPISLAGVDPRTQTRYEIQDFMADKESVASALVNVRSLSNAPWEQAVTMENNRQLLQAGILQAYMPPEKIARMFERGHEHGLYEADNAHRVIAQEENKRILDGDPEVHHNWCDDDYAHVDEHLKVCVTLRYRESPLEIQNAMQVHVESHQKRIQVAEEGRRAMEQPEEQQMAPAGAR